MAEEGQLAPAKKKNEKENRVMDGAEEVSRSIVAWAATGQWSMLKERGGTVKNKAVGRETESNRQSR